jgi:hypothetical protein
MHRPRTLAAALALAGAQADGTPAPRLLPPQATPFGQGYGAWSAAWWRYALGRPAAASPLTDPTGVGCAAGQAGPVFFLAGVAGSGAATRDACIAPAGAALFVPLLTAFDVHVPGDGLDTPPLVWADLHATLGLSFAALHASVDGVPVGGLDPATTPYRACAGPVAGCAPPFALTFPDDNAYGLPPGEYAPAVADGVSLLLAPLPPGAHTLTFGGVGTFAGAPLTQDITYHLTVR